MTGLVVFNYLINTRPFSLCGRYCHVQAGAGAGGDLDLRLYAEHHRHCPGPVPGDTALDEPGGPVTSQLLSAHCQAAGDLDDWHAARTAALSISHRRGA